MTNPHNHRPPVNKAKIAAEAERLHRRQPAPAPPPKRHGRPKRRQKPRKPPHTSTEQHQQEPTSTETWTDPALTAPYHRTPNELIALYEAYHSGAYTIRKIGKMEQMGDHDAQRLIARGLYALIDAE